MSGSGGTGGEKDMSTVTNLLFLWDTELHPKDSQGIMLSGKYKIKYEYGTNSLNIERNNNYAENFWGNGISDCLAVVGNNGSGKSELMKCIAEDIRLIKAERKRHFSKKFVMIFENSFENVLYIFHSGTIKRPKIKTEADIEWKIFLCDQKAPEPIKHFRTAYLNSALHNDNNRESVRIIEFIYGNMADAALQMELPIPKVLRVSIDDNIFSKNHGDDSGLYLNMVGEFVSWLEANEWKSERTESTGSAEFLVKLNEDKAAFISEFAARYTELGYKFNFCKFSLDVDFGEYALLLFFTNLYDIFAHIAWKKEWNSTLLLLIDDANLALHPKWQRMYMKWLLDFCHEFRPETLNIEIILTTHSPLILSDFPAHSICYLSKDTSGNLCACARGTATFAGSIHSLYLDSFLLDDCGTMGAFAEQKINEIVETFIVRRRGLNDLHDMEKTISYIGEGLLREKLEMAVDSYMDMTDYSSSERKRDNEVILDTLRKLKAQRDNLDTLIRDLEGRL